MNQAVSSKGYRNIQLTPPVPILHSVAPQQWVAASAGPDLLQLMTRAWIVLMSHVVARAVLYFAVPITFHTIGDNSKFNVWTCLWMNFIDSGTRGISKHHYTECDGAVWYVNSATKYVSWHTTYSCRVWESVPHQANPQMCWRCCFHRKALHPQTPHEAGMGVTLVRKYSQTIVGISMDNNLSLYIYIYIYTEALEKYYNAAWISWTIFACHVLQRKRHLEYIHNLQNNLGTFRTMLTVSTFCVYLPRKWEACDSIFSERRNHDKKVIIYKDRLEARFYIGNADLACIAYVISPVCNEH